MRCDKIQQCASLGSRPSQDSSRCDQNDAVITTNLDATVSNRTATQIVESIDVGEYIIIDHKRVANEHTLVSIAVASNVKSRNLAGIFRLLPVGNEVSHGAAEAWSEPSGCH